MSRSHWKAVLAAALILSAAQAALAQPSISSMTPGGLAPGKAVEVTFRGDKLTAPLTLWTSFPAKIESIAPAKDQKSVKCKITIPASAPVGIGGVIAANAAGVSDAKMVLVDDLNSVADNGANDTPAKAQLIAFPSAVDGQSNGVKFDYYKFAAKKGQRVSIEVVARRMGSSMDPVLRLIDADGSEIAMVDDDQGLGADCRLRHTCEKDGEYLIEVRDNRYQAGPYRLRVGDFPIVTSTLPLGGRLGSMARFEFAGPSADDAAPLILQIPDAAPTGRLGVSVKSNGGVSSAMVMIAASSLPETVESEPNDDPEKSTSVTLPCAASGVLQAAKDRDHFEFAAKKGQRVDMSALGRSFGSPAFVFMRLLDSQGKTLVETSVTDAEELKLAYTFPADGMYRLSVEDLLKRGGPEFAYRIEMRSGPDFSLVLKNDKATKMKFNSPRDDGAFGLSVQCERRGYDGPVRLELEDSTQGLKLYNNVLAAKGKEVRLFVTVPPEFKEGDFRALRIVGVAEINGRTVRRVMRTEPTLRTKMPQLLYPHDWHNGLITTTTTGPAGPFYGAQAEKKPITAAHGVGGQGQYVFTLQRKAKDFKAGVNVYPEDLPPGVTAAVKAEKDKYTVTVTVAKDAEEGEFHVRLVSIAEHKGRGQTLVQKVPVSVITPVALSIGTPPALVAGKSLKVKVTAVRKGGERNPITFALANLPAGVTGQPMYTIPADKDEIEVELKAAANAAAGASDNLQAQAKSTFQGKEVTSSSSPVRLEVKKAS